MIPHLYNAAEHLPHCPLFLQMYYYLSLEVSVSSRRLHPLCRAATQTNGTLGEQISIDSYSSDSRHKSLLPLQVLRRNNRRRWLTSHGCSQPILLPFLPALYFLHSHSALLQVSLQVQSPGSASESGHPVPIREPAFPPIFLLASSFCFPPFLTYCPND